MDKYPKKTIGELCHIEKGVTGLASAEPGQYPLVATSLERKSCKTYQFDTQAVCIPLVSSTGHGKKSLNYVHYQEGKFALGTILAAVIPKDSGIISAGFLHRYLQFFKETKLVSLMKGAANVSLAVKDIAKIEIPVPPIEEQVRFIELFNKANNFGIQLVGEFNTQSNYLKQLRQSILQDAIEGKLTADWRKAHPVVKGNPDFDAEALLDAVKAEKTRLINEGKLKKDKLLPEVDDGEKPFELPKGWVWCRLGECIINLARGVSPIYTDESNRFIINQKCIRWFDIDKKWMKSVSEVLYSDINTDKLTEFGDLLVNSTGEGTIGRCAIVNDYSKGYLFDTHILRIKNHVKINSYYMMLFINSIFGQNQVTDSKGAKTTKQTELGVNNLNSFVFPLPPPVEQKAIVDRVDGLLSMVDLLQKQVNERKVMADELMQSVLREAFG